MQRREKPNGLLLMSVPAPAPVEPNTVLEALASSMSDDPHNLTLIDGIANPCVGGHACPATTVAKDGYATIKTSTQVTQTDAISLSQ